jgi:(S)-ureidoglycine aminohydrolase
MQRRVHLFLAGSVASVATQLFAAAPFFPVRTLPGGSFVVHAAETREQAKATSSRADYCDQPTATLSRFEVHRTTLQPGAKPHEAHRHEREEMMILLEGELEVLIEETRTRIGAGSAFFVVSNDLHGVTNVGTERASYLVLNFYTPEGAKIPPGAQAAIGSTIWQWSGWPVNSAPPTEVRDFVSAPTRTLPRFEMQAATLHPGASPPGGRRAEELFLLVKDGELEAVAGDGTIRLRPGDLFFVASGQECHWRQVGAVPATYYLVQFRTPATPDSLAVR